MGQDNDKNKSGIDALSEELERDAKVDLTNLEAEMMKVSTLQAKWLNYYTRFERSRIETNKRLKVARGNAYKKLITGTNGYALTKSEANKMQNYDELVVELEEKLERTEMFLKLISEAQQIVKGKSFALGNILKLREFEAGIL